MKYDKPDMLATYHVASMYLDGTGFQSAGCIANDCTDAKTEDPAD